jgi:hypothetical protein
MVATIRAQINRSASIRIDLFGSCALSLLAPTLQSPREFVEREIFCGNDAMRRIGLLILLLIASFP